jgi:molecular chaperone IbpA
MNRTHFNTLSPFTVGFDRVLDRVLDQQEQSTGFPPFNIVKKTDTNFRIELALAGYKDEDLTIKYQEGVLTITGDKENSGAEERGYIHRGISGRKFTRKFTLADDIIVQNAELSDGMLTIQMERIIPEEKRPRTIEINTGIQQSFLQD